MVNNRMGKSRHAVLAINPDKWGVFNVAFSMLQISNRDTSILLDAGYGTGTKTEALRKMGYHTIGIDARAEDIERAKTSFPENTFFQHDLNADLPFASDYFDVIFSDSVFQYINWRNVLQEYKRVVKQDGQLLFIENLRGNPFAQVYRIMMTVIKLFRKYDVPRKYLTYKDLKIVDEYFKNVEYRFCVLFSTIVILIPQTSWLGLDMLRKKSWISLVKLENKLLERFPGLFRWCSRVIIYTPNTGNGTFLNEVHQH